MEKYIERITRYVIENKFPLFEDVEVTSEKDLLRNYTDSKKNRRYNVYLKIHFHPYLMNYIEQWNDIRFLIKNTIKLLGIDNEINVYLNFSDEK